MIFVRKSEKFISIKKMKNKTSDRNHEKLNENL